MIDAPSVSRPFLVRWRVCGGGQGEMKEKREMEGIVKKEFMSV